MTRKMRNRISSKAGKYSISASVVVLLCAIGVLAAAPADDSARAEEVLSKANCGSCHMLGESSGGTGVDLGDCSARDYSIALIESILWNHGSAVWAGREGDESGGFTLTDQQIADLFSYFISHRYLESPGSAMRGKQFFEDGHCADCHGETVAPSSDAPHAGQWESLFDPVAQAQHIWNLSPAMQQQWGTEGNIELPEITAQEMDDLFLYLQHLPQSQGREPGTSIGSAKQGQLLFSEKGCAECHQGELALENRPEPFTAAGVNAAMWNHGLRPMEAHPTLSYDEMSCLIAYIWSARTTGDPERGRKVFTQAGCADCHETSDTGGAASVRVQAGELDLPTYLMSVLWQHGPSMYDEMEQEGVSWPRLTERDVADLEAWLTASPEEE